MKKWKKLDAKYEHILMLLFKCQNLLGLKSSFELLQVKKNISYIYVCVYTIFQNIDFSAWP